MTSSSSSFPAVIAKVAPETEWGENKEIRFGSKHFSSNAKVYIIYGDSGACQSVVAIGHHRKSGRYIRIRMNVKYFRSFKLGYLYSKKGMELYEEFFKSEFPTGYFPNEKDISDLAKALPHWVANA